MSKYSWFSEALRRDAKIRYFIFTFHCHYHEVEKEKRNFFTGKISKVVWSKGVTVENINIVATTEDIARTELKRLYYPDHNKWLKETNFVVISVNKLPIKSLLIEH